MTGLLPWRNGGSGLMDQMHREMDEVFRRFFAPPAEGNAEVQTFAWAPRVDIEETEKMVTVKADLPGVDPKDVEVTVKDRVLTIRGEKKEQREEKGKNFHRVERFEGKFFRQFELPIGLDEANVNAVTTKGVLTVTIPKVPAAQPKKITVKAGE